MGLLNWDTGNIKVLVIDSLYRVLTKCPGKGTWIAAYEKWPRSANIASEPADAVIQDITFVEIWINIFAACIRIQETWYNVIWHANMTIVKNVEFGYGDKVNIYYVLNIDIKYILILILSMIINHSIKYR